MNRVIKFRAWDGEDMITQSARKEYDDYYTMDLDGTFYGHTRTGDEDFVPEKSIENKSDYILMQYTGLHDKNGVEIYEGDIIAMFGGSQFSEVWFCEKWGMWQCVAQISGGINPSEHLLSNLLSTSEVIGNIYQNPELIKTA